MSGSGSVRTTVASSSSNNFMGTLLLAACAMGFSAAVYMASRIRPSSPGGALLDGKHNNSSGIEGGVAAPGSSNGVGGDGPGPSSSRALPVKSKNYSALRADRHVRRHQGNLVAWQDRCLGITIPFSPILFKVSQEQRQAPLVLLSLKYLRQEDHQVVITIEETADAQTAMGYRESSLAKIADCSRIVATCMTRIGSVHHPQAEYCYMDEEDRLVYVLSVFVCHERLALTLQYSVIGARVQNILPTAFYELVRAIRFQPPQPSPSYLLVSEPRLGVGFRLPIDYAVYDGLILGDGVNPMANATIAGGASTGKPKSVSSSAEACAADALDSLPFFSPFAAAVGRGGRHMAVLASYEPPLSAFSALSNDVMVMTADEEESLMQRGDGGGSAWHPFIERQVHRLAQELGLFLPQRVAFKSEAAQHSGRQDMPGFMVLRPYTLHLDTTGNFTDESMDGASTTRTAQGWGYLHEVSLQAGSISHALIRQQQSATGSGDTAYVGLFYVPVSSNECISFVFLSSTRLHTFEEFAASCTTLMQSVSLGNHYGQSTAVSYCCLREDTAPFTLSLTPGRDSVEEPFMGDPVAMIHHCYSNDSRHMPRSYVAVAAAAAGNTPLDATTGLIGEDRTTVMIRVFAAAGASLSPQLPHLAAAGASSRASDDVSSRGGTISNSNNNNNNTAGHKTGGARQRARVQQKRLEHLIRLYLSQLPEALVVSQWHCSTVNAMPSVTLCLDASGGDGQLFDVDDEAATGHSAYHDSDGVDSVGSEWAVASRSWLEEEVGSMNPFSRYYAPPPPPPPYFGLRLAMPNANPDSSGKPKPAAASVPQGGGEANVSTVACADGHHHHDDGDVDDDSERVAVALLSDHVGYLLLGQGRSTPVLSMQRVVQGLAAQLVPLPSV